MSAETIVALATPRGAAVRAVIRLSGPDALAIARRVFEPVHAGIPLARRGVHEGRVLLGRGGASVAGSLWLFSAPGSYTGEDVVELHLPGSPLLVAEVQDRLVRAGARLAEPGEFTRRAFLSGRIDLSRAEAVLATIRARDEGERRSALSALEGGLERRIAAMRDGLLLALVPIELQIDFSDQDLEIPRPEGLDARLREVEEAARALRGSSRDAAPRRASFRVVLEGPANAGKSSLFNRLAGREAAIVSDQPGTTRDVLLAEIEAGGLRILLADTAGHGVETGEPDRQAHLQRARRLREADLVLAVRDARAPSAGLPSFDARAVLVLTHGDLLDAPCALPAGAVLVSNRTGAGVDGLRARIAAALRADPAAGGGEPLMVAARHAGALAECAAAVGRARAALAHGLDAELVASDLRTALASLASVTGEDAVQRVLDEVFSRFCIGK